MTENAGVDPRVAAAEDAADPRPEDETDATMAAEDPAAPDDDSDDAFR